MKWRTRPGVFPNVQSRLFVFDFIPNWRPPERWTRKIIPLEKAQELREALDAEKSLRQVAREVGVSHETVRTAVKVVE